METARNFFQNVIDSKSATDEIRKAAMEETNLIAGLSPIATETLIPTPEISLASPPPTVASTVFPTSTTVSSTSIPVPELQIILSAVNLRSGPGTQYDAIAYLEKGAIVTVIAKNQAGTWYNVELENGDRGWLSQVVSKPVNPALMTRIPVAVTVPALQTTISSPMPSVTLLPTSTYPPTLLPTLLPSPTFQPYPGSTATLLPTGTFSAPTPAVSSPTPTIVVTPPTATVTIVATQPPTATAEITPTP